jgi:hypothetical protein
MQADFAIELGADDEVLEIPWLSPDGAFRYYDLKNRPQDICHIQEANHFPELKEFLAAVNSLSSVLATAKCDAWLSRDINAEEEIFGAECKFGSYVDLFFGEENSRFSLPAHEQFARNVTELLKRVPEIPGSADFLVRRCFYHSEAAATRDGFYMTHYLFGYGNDETQARQQWAIAMKLVENAIRQISAAAQRMDVPS